MLFTSSTSLLLIFSAFSARDVTTSSGDYSLDTTSPATVANPSAQITLSAATDSVVEGVEVFEISISPSMGYTIGTPSKATVYITDVVAVAPTPTCKHIALSPLALIFTINFNVPFLHKLML